jgi:hypothetical protein
VRCHVQVLEKSQDPLFYLNMTFVGVDGRVLGQLEELEVACSRSLNRLAAVAAGRRPSSEVVGESPSL